MRRAPCPRPLAALAALTALTAGACSLPAADKQSDGIARAVYDELRTGADISGDPHVSPAIAADAAGLARLRAMLPAALPSKVTNTGWNYTSSTGAGASAQLAHAYVYADRTIRTQTVMRKAPGQADWTVIGFEAGRDGAAGPPVTLGASPKSASDLD